MAIPSTSMLLKLAFPLVPTMGFTRTALALSVLSLPTPREPLSDLAVSALFGPSPRKTLINAWMDDARMDMRPEKPQFTVRDVLRSRLEKNVPVLPYLPEAFAVLASPKSGLPPLDPRPALHHTFHIADEACHMANDSSTSWYARRTSLAAIYAAAELHQLASPHTAHAFLDSLLDSSASLKATADEVELYGEYVFKSWKGIIRSSGIF